MSWLIVMLLLMLVGHLHMKIWVLRDEIEFYKSWMKIYQKKEEK